MNLSMSYAKLYRRLAQRNVFRRLHMRVLCIIKWLCQKKRNEMQFYGLNLAKCRAMRPRIEKFAEGPDILDTVS